MCEISVIFEQTIVISSNKIWKANANKYVVQLGLLLRSKFAARGPKL